MDMRLSGIRVATVCSGIGSPEQALKNLGIPHEITFACEIDRFSRQTYLANFKPNMMLEDMTKETWEGEQYYSDLFIGGIPCQAFSLAGKRLGEMDPRGLLFYDFYRYVKIQQPKYFIIENVKGLLSDANGATFQNWIQLLGRSENTHINMFNHPDSLEYNLHWKVLNTKDFGLPQNRERVFIVGIRKDLPNTFRFPIGWRLTKRLKDVLQPLVDEKYYLSDSAISSIIENENNIQRSFVNPEIASTLQSPGNACGVYKGANYVSEPTTLHGKQIVNTIRTGGCGSLSKKHSWDIIQEPVCVSMRGRNPDNPSDRTAGVYKEQRIEPNSQGIVNTLSTVQKDNLILEKVGAIDGYDQDGRVYSDSGISSTLDTKCNKRLLIYTTHRIRRLTPLECFRLQGFPDNFIKPVSDTQLYKQAGNTISVPVIQAILNKLLK